MLNSSLMKQIFTLNRIKWWNSSYSYFARSTPKQQGAKYQVRYTEFIDVQRDREVSFIACPTSVLKFRATGLPVQLLVYRGIRLN